MAAGASAQATTPAFTLNATVHDPSVVREGDAYYVFGSHLASARTTDLMNWTQISTSPTTGNALVPYPQTEFAEALTWAETNTFWAPDVIKLADGRFRFYYCACKGDSPRSALGIATANAITGPYSNQAILLRSGMWNQVSPDGRIYDNAIHPNVVDPAVFFDATGKLWMVYGSYSGGLFIMAMDPATGLPPEGQGYGKKLIGGNNSTIEGPYILYSPETQYYYLFFTFGGLAADGGYNVRMGRSRAPDGPYVDAEGNVLTEVKGAPGTYFDNTSIAPYGVKLMGNWQFLHVAGEVGTLSRGYVSPGGVSCYRQPESGKYVIVFHTRFVGRGETHEVRVHQMYLNEDGWFVLAPHRYAQETLTTTDPSQVPGEYKLLNHGKDITATVKTSTIITLKADGSVTGAATGTWAVSGDAFATIVLGGTTYRGVFTPQWDDDNQVWVRAFSAISAGGVAVWGSAVAYPVVNVMPTITAHPQSQTVMPGASVTFSVTASGTPAPTYQWMKNGTALAGATTRTYTVASAAAADLGSYTVKVVNSVGSVTSTAGVLAFPAPPAQVKVAKGTGTAQIVNLSTRGIVAKGEDVLIAGFVISGSANKKVLILGSGWNLRRLGVTGEIGRPKITLYHRVDGVDRYVTENSDWQRAGPEVAPLAKQVYAPMPEPSADPAHGDAALVMTLEPGAYTVMVEPAATSANEDGIGLIEIYDVQPGSGSRLVNISSRGRVETGLRQMIVGAVMSGAGQLRVLVRGVGPTLRLLQITRALANPSEVLYRYKDGTQTVIATNDDWWYSAQAQQIVSLAQRVGAFGLTDYSTDSVMLVRLEPGQYTTIISPSDDKPGVALAELYDVDQLD
ncbi:hypothetical protein DB354_18405 [Opitutus sp. ER46]|nr:hypothetical protein DB354_18405 [Opitutus sp. ER46]